ncbi:CHC2 zinc finger domain-containing protein [Stenotrophomonas sp. Iso1]|uniref:CHC2 zinc finger domain-containing protein n=1 Tax=Stenotrophomonas sp. Iso1 TaxID=2977283 RepID=UPI0022B79425|nr:CHC2 zinc finger domain-containing protein [Stenotrophomonas sp. Iso1]
MIQKRRGPGGNRGHAHADRQVARQVYGKISRNGGRLPDDWHTRLPAPENYYRERVAKLGNAKSGGWAQGQCPFHEDLNASLSVNFSHGGWKCFAGCGSGDLITFHMRLFVLPFTDAARELLGLRA